MFLSQTLTNFEPNKVKWVMTFAQKWSLTPLPSKIRHGRIENKSKQGKFLFPILFIEVYIDFFLGVFLD